MVSQPEAGMAVEAAPRVQRQPLVEKATVPEALSPQNEVHRPQAVDIPPAVATNINAENEAPPVLPPAREFELSD